ncbi:MAG: carboxypeptidase regulatory-like domain-containing protein [Muribaculaceae bacterium]|nr:carboxypeptidase regulatory-like domain-containing protein [Muribaculaceae bacterium]
MAKGLILSIVALILIASSSVCAMAQRLQVVDTDGQPVAYVCVTNEQGVLVGSTDIDGWLDDAKGTPTLVFTHVAFKPRTLRLADIADGRVTLEDVEFGLPDVEVKPKELAYVQTYYRLIYFDDDGPIYFRGGVIDNTYEFANKKVSNKKRSLSKGNSGLIRFLISTLAGRYIDEWGSLSEHSTHQQILVREKQGFLTLSADSAGRVTVSDSICTLGYIDTDLEAGLRTTSFDRWTYYKHRKEAERRAKGKEVKKKEEDNDDNDTFYEVYRIDDQGRSRVDDFVMRQLQCIGTHKRSGGKYMILLQTYTTDRDYIDKKEYKQLRKDNKVDMEIQELQRFEQVHKIPPLDPNIQAQIDKLFEKELGKKEQ